MSKSKITITDENEVVFIKDEKVYPFDEITNFQASEPLVIPPGFDSSSLPFYTLGTLAYLMQCKGVKYSAYVQVRIYHFFFFMSSLSDLNTYKTFFNFTENISIETYTICYETGCSPCLQILDGSS